MLEHLNNRRESVGVAIPMSRILQFRVGRRWKGVYFMPVSDVGKVSDEDLDGPD